MTFEEVYETLPGNGWLSKPEAELLYRMALNCVGPILEVGCHQGRSTVLLASTGRMVYCVDPFEGFDSDRLDGAGILASFLLSLKERGITNVKLAQCRIEDLELDSDLGFGFAYLDGDHSFQGTLAQIRKALSVGASVIAIHDVNDSGGGLEVKRAAESLLGAWTLRIERLAVWVLDS